MRYFISWYPDPPDPPYWKWFEIDGLMISLGNFRSQILRKAINLGLHRFTGFRGDIFLDSGAFQFVNKPTTKTQIEILELQRWLTPDLLSHLDRPYVGFTRFRERERWNMLKETIDNAKVARKWEVNKGGDIQMVYVIQGWNYESIRMCAKKLHFLGVNYYGLGSSFRLKISTIIRRLKSIRKIIGRNANLHLFGVNPLRSETREELEIISSLIDSFDSSTPIMAGSVKELIDPYSRQRKHINLVLESSMYCDCPVCKKFSSSIKLLGTGRHKRTHNRLRAIHNAYWLTKLAHSV